MMTDGGAVITVGRPNTAWCTYTSLHRRHMRDSKSQDKLLHVALVVIYIINKQMQANYIYDDICQIKLNKT